MFYIIYRDGTCPQLILTTNAHFFNSFFHLTLPTRMAKHVCTTHQRIRKHMILLGDWIARSCLEINGLLGRRTRLVEDMHSVKGST